MTKLRLFLLSLIIPFIVSCSEEGWEQRSALTLLPGESIDEYLKREKFKGSVLVFNKGAIVYSNGLDDSNRESQQLNDLDTTFRIASITKQFTAMAIMILHERGQLSVDHPVSNYISDYPKGDQILLWHLLTHTSGMIRGFQSSPPANDVTPEELINLFKNAPLQSTPGEKYSYSNSGYKLLGYIIEKVSGVPYAEFIQQEIFAPLNMSRSGFSPNTPSSDNSAQGYLPDNSRVPAQNMSLAYSGGGLISSINDLYKWDRALYTDQLVSYETLNKIFTPYLNNYGYGWLILESNGDKVQRHGGALAGFSSLIVRTPEQDRVIILLSNEHMVPVNGIARNLLQLITQ
ncbi:serine hydrolase [Pleionea sp. CnH1-48]|uniref:serine hydrolase domain-containing protein n=1 Tax=Pleionea sp. CnH1-48 TaxID=2954494 RepID=UPI0020983655|nr:serine hydrolase domain-containing protein [Pleionea sp. CnH1-48]MCO7223165.1 beta-lactamase family protein [Pleionea sp. CnH1-48]